MVLLRKSIFRLLQIAARVIVHRIACFPQPAGPWAQKHSH
jgi:hypothetical protein